MPERLKLYKTAPYVSGTLVVINIIIFLLCTFSRNMLYNVGGLSPYNFWEEGEYYRLLAAMFFHADIQHLVNNMLLLFGLGAMIEKEIGHLAFAVIYFATGLGGNLISLLHKAQAGEWYVESIGASGAVLGLIGTLLAIVFFSHLQMPNVTPARIVFVVVYSVFSGMSNTSIDNAAHIGGLVTGVLAGGILCVIIRRREKNRINQEGWRISE